MNNKPSTENAQQCGSGLELAVREQTLRICPLGIDHAERTFYNLLEFSTAYVETVRGRCLCQHRDGDGARMDGRANPGERSINIVTENKPKVLEGLSQKGTGAGPES